MNKIKENVAYHLPTISHLLDFLVIADKEELKWDDGKKAIAMAEYLVERYKENMAIIYYDNALWHEDVNEMRKQGYEVVEWEVVCNTSPDFASLFAGLIMSVILASLFNENSDNENSDNEPKIETRVEFSVGDKVRVDKPEHTYPEFDVWFDIHNLPELKSRYKKGVKPDCNTLFTVVAVHKHYIFPYITICAIEDSHGQVALVDAQGLVKFQI